MFNKESINCVSKKKENAPTETRTKTTNPKKIEILF